MAYSHSFYTDPRLNPSQNAEFGVFPTNSSKMRRDLNDMRQQRFTLGYFPVSALLSSFMLNSSNKVMPTTPKNNTMSRTLSFAP